MTLADVARMMTYFKAFYGSRFEHGAAVAEAWLSVLDDLTPRELEASSKGWVQSEKWPPTPADIRNGVARLCTCGRCSPCAGRKWQRDYAAAQAAVTRGAIGCVDDGNGYDRLEAPRGGQRLLE